MKTIERKLHQLDATDMSVGRLATKVANLLRGKTKPEFEPHIDGGDIVEVKNVAKMKFTGKKLDQKEYKSYTGYLGGLRSKKMGQVYASNPGDVLYRAVRDMLPPVKFRVSMLKRLIIK